MLQLYTTHDSFVKPSSFITILLAVTQSSHDIYGTVHLSKNNDFFFHFYLDILFG